jgi:predicted RNase H-like HicB family nuclease
MRRIKMVFHITLEHAEDGWIVAECPALPGCISQGRDEKEAIENIKEAIIAWLWAEDQKSLSTLSKEKAQESIVVAV